MTTIKHNVKVVNVKQEIRRLRETARKVAATKESARQFLISTGMYTASGQIKAQYR